MRKSFVWVAGGAFALLLAANVSAQQQKTVTVWWSKGFYEAEDVAIKKIAAEFEQKTGVKVNLSLFSIEDANTKAISAVEAGSPPDVGFGPSYDFGARGKWAYDNKLDDVSDIIEPMKDELVPVAVKSVHLYDKAKGKSSYYAVPVAAANNYVFYWRDMLEKAGFQPKDIPTEWKPFWDFWCAKVQPALRAKGMRVWGVGNPTSSTAGDTTVEYLTVLSAYGVHIYDDKGNLTINRPDVRQRIIDATNDYVSIYKRGCTPPSSISWLDVDNNNNLHNKTTAMTVNSSLSIPGKYLDEKNDDVYYHKLVTAKLPNGLDGKPISQPTTVKAAVVFAGAKHKAEAHEFLKFFSQPENYSQYVRGALGRWVPVQKAELHSAFWTDGKDPHRLIAAQVALAPLEPFPSVYDYRFTAAISENVWGIAMTKIIQQNVPTAKAVDDMIKRISELLG